SHDLVPEATHDLRGRANEDDARLRARLRKLRVLRKKTVARVNRIHLGRLSDPDDVRDIQIGIDRRFTGTDEIAFVRLHPVQRETILLRIDGDRANAELSRDRKSTRLNSSHVKISYAVFC